MSDKQLAALSISSKKKKTNALLKTEKAITKLINDKKKITIRSVAREAGVSTSYIYKYPELAYKIQTLREQQKYSSNKRHKVDSNNDNCLNSLELKNAELVQEIEQLKNYIDKIKTSTYSSDCLQAENFKLLAENEQLKKELGYTKKNLQQAREFILNQGRDYILEESQTNTDNTIIHRVRKIKQK